MSPMTITHAEVLAERPSPIGCVLKSAVVRATFAVVVAMVVAAVFSGVAWGQGYVPDTVFSAQVTPTGVAVNQASGDIYVSTFSSPAPAPGDPPGSGVILRFNSSEVQVGSFSAPTAAGPTYASVAVDPVDGDVYALDLDLGAGSPAPTIRTFTAAGVPKGTPIPVAGAPVPGQQIATDSAGNVYFANMVANEVQGFTPAGLPLAPITGGADPLSMPFDVAVGTDGSFYIADNAAFGPNGAEYTNARVRKYSSAGVLQGSALASGDVKSVGIDPVTDRVFVGQGADKGGTSDFEIAAFDAGVEVDRFGKGDFTMTNFNPQPAVNSSTGKAYVTDPLTNNEVETYVWQAPPDATTDPASPVGTTTATLKATVNPNGLPTSCQFQYGTTTAYGKTAPCAPDPGSGVSDVAVSAAVSGLSPSTEYHYRVTTLNAGGADSGDDATFTTGAVAPSATTTAASGVGQTAATLNGTVNPNGAATSCEFEWGTTNAYGNTAPCASSPGSGSGSVAVTANLAGLIAGTTYHYRLKAISAGGSATGTNQTFTTTTPPPGGGGGGGGGGTPPPPPPPVANGALKIAATATVKAGKAQLKLTCTGGPCKAGVLQLKAKVKKGNKTKTLTIGKATCKAMTNGQTVTLSVKLSGPAKAALAKTGKLKAAITGNTTGKVTLKGKKKKGRG